MPNYHEQEHGSICGAIGAANLGLLLQHPTPSLDELINLLRCKHGAAIGLNKVLRKIFGDKIQPTNSFTEFMQYGGLLTIQHPIFNLHITLCYPEEKGYTWVNSWLGPHIAKNIGFQEIKQFLPARHLTEMYRIKDKLEHAEEHQEQD